MSQSAPGPAVRPFSVVPKFYPASNSACSPWLIQSSPDLPPWPPINLSEPTSVDTPVPATQSAGESATSAPNQPLVENDVDEDDEVFGDISRGTGTKKKDI